MWKVVVVIQKVVITMILCVVYFGGFGIMFVVAWLFRRRVLTRGAIRASSWVLDPEGYDVTAENARRES